MSKRTLLELGSIGLIALLVGCLQVSSAISLEAAFTGTDPHIERRFEASLIEQGSDTEIGRLLVVSVPSANFILAAVDSRVLVIEDHFGTGQFSHGLDASQDIIESAGIESGGRTIIEFSIPMDSGNASGNSLLPGRTYVLLLAMYATSDNLAMKHTTRSTTQFTLNQAEAGKRFAHD